MKKISMILTLLLISTAMSFSQVVNVNDNTGATGKTGAGSFGAKILMPLKIDNAAPAFLGEFVKSDIPYTPDDALFETTTLDFTIGGEPGHEFFYSIEPDFNGNKDGAVAIITLSTPGPLLPSDPTGFGDPDFSFSGVEIEGVTNKSDILNGDGSFTIQIMVTSLTAKGSGTDDFVQTVYVSYKTF